MAQTELVLVSLMLQFMGIVVVEEMDGSWGKNRGFLAA